MPILPMPAVLRQLHKHLVSVAVPALMIVTAFSSSCRVVSAERRLPPAPQPSVQLLSTPGSSVPIAALLHEGSH